jgi:hypothetical protein
VSVVVLALLAAAPSFSVDPDVGTTADVEREAERHWAALTRLWKKNTGDDVAGPEHIAVRARRDFSPGVNGRSAPGVVQLRPSRDVFTRRQRLALKHELAHQLLLAACPAAANDRLFHEAFAIWTSGELTNWLTKHITLQEARTRLAKGIDDRPSARAAIARLLAEAEAERTLVERMRQCKDGGRALLTVTALTRQVPAVFADADVVLSRHSGAVIAHSGAPALKMPFGSTLKPFVVAAHGPGPDLPVGDTAMWKCGARTQRMKTRDALLASCNGYFLDWAPPATFGPYQPLFDRFDVRPRVVAEAIGLASRLQLSAFELAQAYRVLAEAEPSLMKMLRANRTEGTLAAAGLTVEGATKTGTVRDADSRPRVGWIVFVDDDFVVVMAREGRAPSTFAPQLDTLVRGLKPRGFDVERGHFRPGCELDGIEVSVGKRLVVGRHVPNARWLCLGGPTVNGPGVVDGDRLRVERGTLDDG